MTNAEFVAKRILDDDDLLMKQAGSSLERTLDVDRGVYVSAAKDEEGKKIRTSIEAGIKTKAGEVAQAISQSRAEHILSNDTIGKKEEQRTALEERLKEIRGK